MTEHNPFPNKDEYRFPEELKKRYSQLTDWDRFVTYSLSFPQKAIRINTLKASIPQTLQSLHGQGWTTEQVPWCKEGFMITGERRDLGNIPEHALGHIYVQDAASMLPAIILNPRPGDRVLDCCAAPGSKTTHLSQYMENTGLLMANDSDQKRIEALKINLNRCGCSNTIVTRTQFHKLLVSSVDKKKTRSKEAFFSLRGQFDKILVDAPCSGMGIIRKSPQVINQWKPSLVRRLAEVQLQLLSTAFELLRSGGELVYSTCTPEPEENEGVITRFLETYHSASLLPIDLSLNRSEPITSFVDEKDQTHHFHPDVSLCLRIWPQDNNTEGFFVAHIVKD